MKRVYKGGSTITGRPGMKEVVTFKASLSKKDRLVLLLFLALILSTSLGLIAYLLESITFSGFNLIIILAVALALLVEVTRVLQSITLIVFAYFAKDPVPMIPGKKLRIAVLTTIVPGKEPFEMVAKTLAEMKRIKPGPGNKLDVWLLDEGNDQFIKSQCRSMGVKHFSRKSIRKWNTKSGPFRARTKHGNHNAWRSKYENRYDIVAQMDPDHVPRQNFLLRTLGYFKDPDVAFVVAPQVYGNLKDNWIAKASACQAYIFHGIVQRGGNGMKAPLLIGTNHLYRVKAFKQIKGYQDSIIEDHLTSMIISGVLNKASGNTWKGVYTPDILAVGEGPTSFTDYFNQQKRWAYGICEIVSKHSPTAFKKLNGLQKLTFMMLQFFYPSLAVLWSASFLVTLLFGGLVAGGQSLGSEFAIIWVASIASSLGLFFWLRKFNLVEHERQDWCLQGMALTLMCLPVYFSAAWEAITHKPLTFAVTAKGELASPDTWQTFRPHLQWLGLNLWALIMICSFTQSLIVTSSSVAWIMEHIAVCLSPVAIYVSSSYQSIIPALKSAFRLRKPALLQLNITSK